MSTPIQTEINNYLNRTPNPIVTTNNPINLTTLVTPKPDKYNFSVNKFDQEITTNDVYQRDLNTALDQQNALYIVGTITCATLLITALLIAK